MDTPKSLIFRYLAIFSAVLFVALNTVRAEESPPYASYFNPQVGFKPAQVDFAAIFLQLAGSLEFYGTPEPYVRHVMAEHTRIAAKYQAAKGKDGDSRPEYLTDKYVETMLGNWKKLTPGLALDSLCRESGRNMRYAIKGSWNMAPEELAAEETNLSPDEKKFFATLIGKSYFRKEDLKEVDRFYNTVWDKLSDNGKLQVSKRTRRGQMDPAARAADIKNDQGGSLVVKIFNQHHDALMNYLTSENKQVVNSQSLQDALRIGLKLEQDEITLTGLNEYERDAFKYSHVIRSAFQKRFNHIQTNVKNADDAKSLRRELDSMTEDLLVIAHSEFRAALMDARSN